MMKGIPMTYSKDMQEDKEPVFDALDTVDICLQVFTGVWSTMTICVEQMESNIDSNALATDLADDLVNKGLPFREAHHIVGRLVRETLDKGTNFTDLRLGQLLKFSDRLSSDTLKLLDLRGSLSQRNISGGTGPEAVRKQLKFAKEKISY
jgi:argininosuccinate lyase